MIKSTSFDMVSVQQQIDSLTERINYFNERYYQDDVSEISDQEFDGLLKQLFELEKQHPEFKRDDSPTQRVGGTINKTFQTVYHRFPMLSLDNTYSEDELRSFDNRVKKALGDEPYEYICELKFDGISLSFTYENNVLKRGVTRGDGKKGDDITHNTRTIKSLPLRIKSSEVPEFFEVRGEGFMPYASFEKLNEELEILDAPLYANPRNAASGAFKLQDSAETARRNLECYIYSFLSEGRPFETHEESLLALKRMGFNVSPGWRKCRNIEEAIVYIHEWQEKRFELPLATDGIVIKVNSIRQQLELGATSKSPRWAISYKYQAENKPAVLRFVTYQVGRTGAVTPVANLCDVSERELDYDRVKGVHLSGTQVKRATLHNANELERLDLRTGDVVFVEKSGEIIPKITGVDTNARNRYETWPVVFPENCPECETALIREPGEAVWFCPNDNGCPPQIKGRIEHFIHRKAMNIDSLGEGKIELLFDKNLVETPADLYTLTYDQLLGLEKTIVNESTGKTKRISFREKTVENILNGIAKSKEAPFPNLLFALGIRFVGATVAEKLASYFGSMEALQSASYETLLTVPEIGPRIAMSVRTYFEDPRNQSMIARLRSAGLQFEDEQAHSELESDILSGFTFVISGVFEGYSREELRHKIEINGGKVLTGVSGKLHFLLAGENMGPSKLEKAIKLGVKVISLEELDQMLYGE